MKSKAFNEALKTAKEISPFYVELLEKGKRFADENEIEITQGKIESMPYRIKKRCCSIGAVIISLPRPKNRTNRFPISSRAQHILGGKKKDWIRIINANDKK